MEKHASKPANSVGSRMSDGDWVCPDVDCGNINFSRRNSCNRCGKERADLKSKKKLGTEIGKSAADKSRGLFSADDWQCSKCANVNWARRQTCNVCNAPKFGEVEARTGYGGGYNERGTVEYRPRRDSDDDEYDEFGRKKKKKSQQQHSEKVITYERIRSLSAGSQAVLPSQGDTKTTTTTTKAQQDERLEALRQARVVQYLAGTKRSSDTKRDRKKSSDCSNERLPGEHTDSDPRIPRSAKRTSEAVSTEKPAAERSQPRQAEQWHSGQDYAIDRLNYLRSARVKSPRECIMENRVSSTNDIKYRFTGPTIDENFEVVYTLEERIKAAAWAIAYQNCRTSAEHFQNVFDKPAPDFKTIFAWRQRLLYTGCLVDKHINVAESSESRDERKEFRDQPRMRRRIGWRKRGRYFRKGDTTESSTGEERPLKVFHGNVRSLKSTSESDKVIIIEAASHEDPKSETKNKTETEESEDSEKESQKEADNRNVAPIVVEQDETKNSDSCYTEVARSITPEMLNLRADLAHFDKSPVRVASTDHQFQEDIYFEDDLPLASKTTLPYSNPAPPPAEPAFLVPEVPKMKKQIVASLDDSLKNQLEDIISESERYSSEDESDFVQRIYGKNVLRKSTETKTLTIEEAPVHQKYQPSSSSKPEVIDLPLPRFGQQQKNQSECIKNMSTAMRRIFESMNTQSKDIDTINNPVVEYIPTKIDPAMAKRNHQLFNSDPVIESIHEIFAESNMSGKGTSTPKKMSPEKFEMLKRKEPTEKPFKIQMFEDYLPDEDALYKNSSSDSSSDSNSGLKTPPRAPNIGSFKKTVSNNEPYCGDISDKSNVSENLYTNVTSHLVKDVEKIPMPEPQTIVNVADIPTPADHHTTCFASSTSININKTKDLSLEQPISKTKVQLNPIPDEVTLSKNDAGQLKPIVDVQIKPAVNVPKQQILVQSKPKVDVQQKTNIDVQSIPKIDVQSKPYIDVQSKPKIDIQSKPKIDIQSKPKIDIQSKPKIDVQSNPKMDVQLKPKIDVQSNPKIDAHSNHKIDVQPNPKIDVQSKPKTDIQSGMVQIDAGSLASLLNFNFSSINASDLLTALTNIQTLAVAAQRTSVEQVPIEEGPFEIRDSPEELEEEIPGVCVSDVEVSPKPNKKNADIPFLGDMFDPGSPVQKEKNADDNNSGAVVQNLDVQETNLDDLLDLPHTRPVIGAFKSFAIPKPIMLNRLRSMNQQQQTAQSADREDGRVKGSKKGARKKKKLKLDGDNGGDRGGQDDEEEDEESGEEGDLSKYDLWGSEDEQPPTKDDMGKVDKSPTAVNEAAPEKADGDLNSMASPQSKNSSEGKRKRRSSERSKSRSRSGSSSSSSSTSSDSSEEGPTPRNRYDDFNLNSEHSRAGSAESSRSRSHSGERRRSSKGGSKRSRRPAAVGASSSSSHRRRSKDRKRGKDSADSRRQHRSHRHRR